jgi:hypothetical protein
LRVKSLGFYVNSADLLVRAFHVGNQDHIKNADCEVDKWIIRRERLDNTQSTTNVLGVLQHGIEGLDARHWPAISGDQFGDYRREFEY